MLIAHPVLISCLVALFALVLLTPSHAANYEEVSYTQRCQNPNGRIGRCISIYECPSVLNIIRRHQTANYGFARKSECHNGGGHRPHVCCTGDTGFTQRAEYKLRPIIFPRDDDDDNSRYIPTSRRPSIPISTTTAAPQLQNTDLFPKPPECGPISVVNKIYGGEETELGEFPWLTNLEYLTTRGDLVSVCSGNIINYRYVLTAAHCIKGKIEQKIGKLVSLRAGDHNTNTPVDCNNLGCIDPYQRFKVDRVIVHPQFSQTGQIYNHHDIGLIRTDRNIIFSDTIAPICLPDVMGTLPALRSGMRLTVAGWGHNGTAKYTAEKRKVDVPFVENRDCPFQLPPEQLCAGGEFLKDSCAGDSGGSLAHLTQNGWFIEGLVSYGKGCGLEVPAVYTRVRSYIQWIHNNV